MNVCDFSHLDEELLAKVARLRIEGWETEAVRAAEQSDWLDKFERATLRWSLYRDGVPLAAARLSLHHGWAEGTSPVSVSIRMTCTTFGVLHRSSRT
jgi:hypothetical protein